MITLLFCVASNRQRFWGAWWRRDKESKGEGDMEEWESGMVIVGGSGRYHLCIYLQSREERKTEAVWRMFEKMEASERRRHHLLSESSQDGEHSPSTQRMGKERYREKERKCACTTHHILWLLMFLYRRTSVSSTGSKKSHILPTSKLWVFCLKMASRNYFLYGKICVIIVCRASKLAKLIIDSHKTETKQKT